MSSNTIDNIYNAYLKSTQESGNVLGNDQGVKSVTYKNGELLFEENDGDVINVAAEELSESALKELNKKLGIVSVTDNSNNENKTETQTTAENITDEDNQATEGDKTNKTDGKTDNTDKTEESKKTDLAVVKEKLEADKAKLETSKIEISSLLSRTENIEKVVEQLSKEIEESLTETAKKQKELSENEQERIQKVIDSEIELYKNDKKNGKNVTPETLAARIESGMQNSGFDSEMQTLMSDLILTNSKIGQMDKLLGELGTLDERISDLDGDISDLEECISDGESEVKEAEAKSHDPIGFELDGSTYEFVIDRDGSKDLTDVSEFLGAKDNFAEMTALDKDESGNVDKSELSQAGVMVLVKDKKTGEQSLKSLDEAFGENDINIDTANFKDLSKENAKADNGQQLLGNFNISVGEDSYTGYSTLDSDEYLAENYKFSGTSPVANNKTENNNGANETEFTQQVESNETFKVQYTEKLNVFKETMDGILEGLGLNDELKENIKELGIQTGIAEADKILSEIEEKAKKEAEAEAQEAKKAEEAKKEKEEADKADENNEVDNDDNDEEVDNDDEEENDEDDEDDEDDDE